MAQATLDPAEFCSRLRIRLGEPSLDEVSEAMLDEGIRAVLDDISKVSYLDYTARFFFLQPFVEDYTIPGDPDFVFDLVPSGPLTPSGRAFGLEFQSIPISDFGSFGGVDDFIAHALEISQYREFFEQFEWNFFEPPTLKVLTPPTVSIQTIIITGKLHETVATIPIAHEETLFVGALGEVQNIWANKRDSLSVLSTPAAMGTIELINGTILRERAKENRDAFKNRLGWNRPTITQG